MDFDWNYPFHSIENVHLRFYLILNQAEQNHLSNSGEDQLIVTGTSVMEEIWFNSNHWIQTGFIGQAEQFKHAGRGQYKEHSFEFWLKLAQKLLKRCCLKIFFFLFFFFFFFSVLADIFVWRSRKMWASLVEDLQRNKHMVKIRTVDIEILFDVFSIFSSGFYFLQGSGTVWAISKEDNAITLLIIWVEIGPVVTKMPFKVVFFFLPCFHFWLPFCGGAGW